MLSLRIDTVAVVSVSFGLLGVICEFHERGVVSVEPCFVGEEVKLMKENLHLTDFAIWDGDCGERQESEWYAETASSARE